MQQFLFGLFSRLTSVLKFLVKQSDGSDTQSSPSELSPESFGSVICTIPWGQKVSQTFRNRVVWCAKELDIPVDYLMAVIAFESAETFSPSIKNQAGSGATGLVQFMPATAKGLGTTVSVLETMTAEDQLNYVYKYFLPYKGKLKTLSDVYMAVLWPRAIGQPETHVLWEKASKPTTYRQNSGLDINKDGAITKAEAAAKVQAKIGRGLLQDHIWHGEVHPWG